MRNPLIICSVAFALLLVGCKSEVARFDTSDEVTFKTSSNAVRSSVAEEERPRFDKAMKLIVLHSLIGDEKNMLGTLGAMAAAGNDPSALLAKFGSQINGRTAAEVIAVADDIERNRNNRQLAATEGEITALEAKLEAEQSKYQKARLVLDNILIEGARYYWQKGDYQQQAVIAFKITNNTGRAIAKIVMSGLLETPGRSVPWVKEAFTYTIGGGLEPGERQNLKLAPGMFGSWSKRHLKTRKNLVLTITLTGVTDHAGVDIGGRSSDEINRLKSRLQTLKKNHSELQVSKLSLRTTR
jgi:Family of unknown function (DUF6694)